MGWSIIIFIFKNITFSKRDININNSESTVSQGRWDRRTWLSLSLASDWEFSQNKLQHNVTVICIFRVTFSVLDAWPSVKHSDPLSRDHTVM